MLKAVIASVIVAALVLAPCDPRAQDDNGTALRVPQSLGEIQLSFAPVVRAAAPAVVNIYTRKTVERRMNPFAADPMLERFFGEFFGQRRQQRAQTSLGSGVIVDASGVVVSNHHVVAGADEITVVLSDRREFSGEVILADEAADLAVVQLDGASDLPVLPLRDSDTLEVGDLVLAIGNPFGVGQTVTSGIVSGLARAGARRGEGGYFIQTDAAINPGNSGGALIDMSGRLVGVPTSILSRSGGSIGIGFAVPANLVSRVIAAARAGEERLERPWLGIETQAVTGDIAPSIGLTRPEGVLVSALHPASPLAEAGLERGDVITALDGQAVNSPGELNFRAATLGPGRSVTLDTMRRGEIRQLTVALEPAPDEPPFAARMVKAGAFAGVTLGRVNPRVIVEYGLSLETRGLIVVGLSRPASRTRLREGDVILSLNGEEVASPEDLDDVPEPIFGGRITLIVERDGRRGRISLGG